MSKRDKIDFSSKQQKLILELLGSLSNEQANFIGDYLIENAAAKAFASAPAVAADAPQLTILYGSESGNAETLADKAKKIAARSGFKPHMREMLSTKLEDLVQVKNLLIVVSTWGEGDPPERAVNFYKNLKANTATKFPETKFAVLSLGDSSYVNFCQTGREADELFKKYGATRLFNRIDCDVDFEKPAMQWLDDYFKELMSANGIDASAVAASAPKLDIDAAFGFESPYTQNNPYEAAIKEKVLLNEEGSLKETYHFEVDLSGSGIRYNPGDALGIYPVNDAQMVEDILQIAKFSGDETIDGKTLRHLLSHELDINTLSIPVIDAYAELCNDPKVKALTENIGEYSYGREIIDMLAEYPVKGITPEQFAGLFRKLPHRLYSISSSQEAVGEEVHLTIGAVRYDSYGRKRKGVASGFVADDVKPNDKVKVFVKQNKNFRLPENNHLPVIMVGPGTGIAPFRAFLQQRDIEGAKGKNWLFFGEQHYLLDFFYQLEWQEFKDKGLLTNFDAGFSRDQPEKIYVQDKMWAKRAEFYDWLEQGAYFYVCGDEKRMAKDVDDCLHKIIAEQSGKGPDFAIEYIHTMKTEKRYLRDVY